ncbi:MAG: PQQ-dependent sugar dehydrogenase [Planctomycetes bacterium]|nr:PQQ-dependent sugar dehydrogenase [Planctomycetota bacterium]
MSISCCAIVLAACAQASNGEPLISATLVGSGFDNPLYVTHAPGDSDRIFVVEQPGKIRIVDISQDPPVTQATPFLDIRARVVDGGERGLLGLAFHPDFDTNGWFYVNYTELSSGGGTVVSRFTVPAETPDVADETSEVVLLTIAQPEPNHNGGWIAFGPDGMLYIATGDGGGGGDSGAGHTPDTGNAQDITDNLLGKILRVDVNGSNAPSGMYGIPANNPFVGVRGDDEIWSYGLRNPWRNSFDPVTGELYITDVGQSNWEEINVQPGDSTGGENWGWRCREGMHDFDLSDPACATANLLDPIHEYSHDGPSSPCSIIGGEVYRGCAMAQLRGAYFFGDFCSGQIWTLRYDGVVATVQERTQEFSDAGISIPLITSFGRDAEGEIYICSNNGDLFKIIPLGEPANCNAGVPTVSTWGLIVLQIGLLLAATLLLRHRRTFFAVRHP